MEIETRLLRQVPVPVGTTMGPVRGEGGVVVAAVVIDEEEAGWQGGIMGVHDASLPSEIH